MTPLGLFVLGFALVILDFRFEGFDLAPDAIGWVVTVVGLVRLADRSPWFRLALAAAAVGVPLGLLEQLAEASGALLTVLIVVETVVVFAVCSGVAAVAGDPGIRSRAVLIRWLDLGITAAAPLLLLADDVEPALVLVLALGGLGVAAWFMIFLLSVRNQPPLQSGGATSPAHP